MVTKVLKIEEPTRERSIRSSWHGKCSVSAPDVAESFNLGGNPMGILKKQSGFTLIELMIVVAILGIVAALAIPNFLRYQVQTRQSEVRTNLGAIYVSETSYYGERSTFGTFDQIGFTLAGRTNRYAYRVGPGGTANVDLLPPMIGLDPGQNTIVPSDLRTVPVPGFTAAATANLDVDPVVDMWHVNDLKEGLQNADQNDVR